MLSIITAILEAQLDTKRLTDQTQNNNNNNNNNNYQSSQSLCCNSIVSKHQACATILIPTTINIFAKMKGDKFIINVTRMKITSWK